VSVNITQMQTKQTRCAFKQKLGNKQCDQAVTTSLMQHHSSRHVAEVVTVRYHDYPISIRTPKSTHISTNVSMTSSINTKLAQTKRKNTSTIIPKI